MGRKVLQWSGGAAKSAVVIEGVFVGWRNAQEGITRYGDEDGPQFTVEERPLVALVAYDVRKNPVMVHFTDVTPLTSPEGERHNAKREAATEVGERIKDKVCMGDNSPSEAAAGETVVAEYLAELGEWEQ